MQIGREVGVVGIGLFIAIIYFLAKNFWQQRRQLVPRVLFVSLVGLSVANLFLHTWTNDAVALTFWSLAGLYFTE